MGVALALPLGRRILGMPREGGAYGVWLSGTAYGLLSSIPRGADEYLLASAIAGAAAAILLLDYARHGRGAARVLGLVPALPLILVAAFRAPYSIPLALYSVALLAVSMGSRGVARVVAGGGLLGSLGGYLALASPEANAMDALLPGYYLLMATGFAGIRAARGAVPAVAGAGLGLLLTITGVLHYAFTGLPVVSLVIAVDVALRVIGLLAGVYDRMSLRAYGFLEAFRTLAVMAVSGAAVGGLV